MSKNRKHAKRELQRSIDNINWSLHHLKSYLDMGYGELKELSEPLTPVLQSLIVSQKVLEVVRDKI